MAKTAAGARTNLELHAAAERRAEQKERILTNLIETVLGHGFRAMAAPGADGGRARPKLRAPQ